jgi:CHRD domain
MKLKATLALSIFSVAAAQPALGDDDHTFNAHLVGFKEVPSISTSARGGFKAQVNDNETAIDWELSYEELEGQVQQAHIHFAQRGVNGGITVFLCTILPNGPAGIQPCPPSPATITGTIMAADVSPNIPATEMARTQGINTGEFDELLRAMRGGATYANVHSTTWPGGEVRGQIRPSGRHDLD